MDLDLRPSFSNDAAYRQWQLWPAWTQRSFIYISMVAHPFWFSLFKHKVPITVSHPMISDWYHPDATLPQYSTRHATYMTKPWEISWMLWKLAQTPGNIVEIGARYGETTREFALAFPERKVYAVDYPTNPALPLPQRNEIPVAEKFCESARGLPNVQVITQDSRTLDYRMFDDVGFIFIDGDHSFDGVAADSEKAFAHFSNRPGVVVWHDCYPHEYIAVHAYLTSREQRWPGRFKTVIGTSLAYAEFPPALP